MSQYPTLHKIGLGPQLEALERVAARGQVGKYAGRKITEKTADFHFQKGDGHLVQAGRDLNALDEYDTNEPHLILAALRFLFAAHCATKDGSK